MPQKQAKHCRAPPKGGYNANKRSNQMVLEHPGIITNTRPLFLSIGIHLGVTRVDITPSDCQWCLLSHQRGRISIVRFLETCCKKWETNQTENWNSSIYPLRGRHTQFYCETSYGEGDLGTLIRSANLRRLIWRKLTFGNWAMRYLFLNFFYVLPKPQLVSASLGSVKAAEYRPAAVNWRPIFPRASIYGTPLSLGGIFLQGGNQITPFNWYERKRLRFPTTLRQMHSFYL